MKFKLGDSVRLFPNLESEAGFNLNQRRWLADGTVLRIIGFNTFAYPIECRDENENLGVFKEEELILSTEKYVKPKPPKKIKWSLKC